MIRVERTPKPAVLAKNEEIWREDLLQAKTESARKKAESKYRHGGIQKALKQMFHDKCAYCESKISHISHAHIEHFRPKSRFPEWTFDWENLLWTCGICNSDFKKDQYPEASEGGPILNPCEDDPEAHLEFVFDFETKLATVIGITERGTTTERILQLNRPDLRTCRSERLIRMATLIRLASQDKEAQLLLQKSQQADAEYAAFVRTLVRKQESEKPEANAMVSET